MLIAYHVSYACNKFPCSLRSLGDTSSSSPSIEIISSYGDADSNELPPGTKIITHPMNSARFGGKKHGDFAAKR